MSPRPAPRRRPAAKNPPVGASGVSRRNRRDLRPEEVPPIIRSYIDGYRIQPTAFGYEIRLRVAWTDGTPSMVSQGPWWALTTAGAHRKAARLIQRDRRRRDREAAAQEYDA